MSHMIRKQIYLEAAQDALLKQRAQELGVSEAALIRRCLESMEQPVLPRDRQAWEDERAFVLPDLSIAWQDRLLQALQAASDEGCLTHA